MTQTVLSEKLLKTSGNMTMVVDGHTGIEHSIPIPRIYNDALTLWAGSETYYTPTLVVGYGGLWGENYWYQVDNVWENERLMDFVPRFVVDPRARRRVKVPDEEFNHFNNLDFPINRVYPTEKYLNVP